MPDPAPSVLACVLTRDEAHHIQACLATVAWAAGRLVVDSGSTDATVRLAQSAGAEVVSRAWDGWAGQRNFAVAEATRQGYHWIFFVDADERVPDDLRMEVMGVVAAADGRTTSTPFSSPPSRSAPPAHEAKDRKPLRRIGREKGDRGDKTEPASSAYEVISGDAAPVGFWVPRRNIIVGKWIRHAGWDPDYQLRLFRTDRGRYDPARPVHELVMLDGPAAFLTSRLVHLNYDTWGQFWAKQRRYAATEAFARQQRGQRICAHNFILQPWREFWRRYVTLEGWRSGTHGLALSVGMAAAEFATLADHWRLAAAEEASDPRIVQPTSGGVSTPLSLWRRGRGWGWGWGLNQTPLSLRGRSGGDVLRPRRPGQPPWRLGGPDATAPDVVASCDGEAVQSRTPPPCDLAVVVVSYDVAELLRECLASIRDAAAQTSFRVHAIVVDNASHDDSVAVAQASRDTTVIANRANVGFGAACNQGFAVARAAGARHVLFLNPDARIEPNTLQRLVDAIERAPRVGLIGPAVVGPDGSAQPPRRRFPTITDLVIESTPLDWRGNGTTGRAWPVVGEQMARYRGEDLPDRTGDVEWLSGSCILVRTDAFAQVGGFDPTFFMYFEETDLARRLDKAGWTCRYFADATVFHHGSRSASQDLRARDRRYYGSKLAYARRYHGRLGEVAVRVSHAKLFAIEAAWQAIRADPRASARHFAIVRQMLS